MRRSARGQLDSELCKVNEVLSDENSHWRLSGASLMGVEVTLSNVHLKKKPDCGAKI